ncbi:MAG: NAD-dependent protein deacylase [Clostridia bacterium]|nr:NAD-dependent protein deacylase [Clostridia bacterium]
MENNIEKIDKLIEFIKECNNIVFFGGAGVSTESGIPDFRSKDGLYNMKYDYPPEEILSHTFFVHNPEEFYRFYKDKLNSLKYEPNITHKVLAKLEKIGKLTSVVTQNIDGLHQKAGSKKVLELHGSVLRNYCTKCNTFYDANYIFNSKTLIPKCEKCGQIIKPDVVLYEEPLNNDIYDEALKDIAKADMLIIGGTSLAVYPASYLVQYFRGKYLILINKSTTPLDSRADLVIHDSLGTVFARINEIKF